MDPRLLSALCALLVTSLSTSLPATERAIARSSLVGVWEVIAFESPFTRSASSPKSRPNYKYCFSLDQAYRELSPDSAGDSADGGGEYYIAGGNILVIRTGAPEGLYAYNIDSVSNDKLIWYEGSLRVTLRRIAKVWRPSHAPKVRPKDIRIRYLQ